ncbi:hypothetical protein E4U53_007913 [Claviceps sorghi]|nr:hypothetical protein E4U53_007913 [Claviceps sorghi]
MSATATTSSQIPHIHLLCMHSQHAEAFLDAAQKYHLPSSVTFKIHKTVLEFIPATTKFDLVVSPANSYGRLDGGFDDAISRAFSPQHDYLALTQAAQDKLYYEWYGFAPPGSCTLVRIPDEFAATSKNVWGTKYLALCTTMRTPQSVAWDREIVYESIWSLLVSIEKHNRRVLYVGRDSDGESIRIQSILLTPVATGIGRSLWKDMAKVMWHQASVMDLFDFEQLQMAQLASTPANWSDGCSISGDIAISSAFGYESPGQSEA